VQMTGLGIRRHLSTRASSAVYDIWGSTLDTVLRARLIERTTGILLSSGVVERVAVLVAEHPATDRVVTLLLESPGFDRMLDRILASEQLDRVVTQIAESDEVRGALRQQSTGMAEEVAGELRSRTAAADARLERLARSLLRRHSAPQETDLPNPNGR
jgi:hypothetical protein